MLPNRRTRYSSSCRTEALAMAGPNDSIVKKNLKISSKSI